MPSIKIKELDNTTGGISATSTEVVYIPGFVSINQTDFDSTGDIVNVETPSLCTTVVEFERKFGKKPLQFDKDQNMPAGFSADAMPLNKKFASAGDYDKSYIMAKELLNDGVPVLYERINPTNPVLQDLILTTTDTTFNITSIVEQYAVNGTCYFINNKKCLFIPDTPENDGKATTIVFDDVFTTSDRVGFGSGVILRIAVSAKAKTSTKSGTATLCVNNQSWVTNSYTTAETNATEYQYTSSSWNPTLPTGITVPADFEKESNKFTIIKLASIENSVKNSASVDYMYDVLTSTGFFDKLSDRGEYDFKYLTTGGYPLFELNSNAVITALLSLVESRGDCFVLIDSTDTPNRALTGEKSVYAKVEDFAKDLNDSASFATMFTPWINVICNKAPELDVYSLPGSFGYLKALAKSIRNNPSWLAIAGAVRGQVDGLDNLNTNELLTNAIAENEFQNRDGISINAITKINPFGLRIWGNRTLKNNATSNGNLTATSFLNIRNLICDVKKVLYKVCRKLTFEPDNDVLWVNFKAGIEPTLDRMKTGSGISGYKILREPSNEKAKLKAKVVLYPVYAVEDFEITVTMEDEGITIS